MTGPGTFGRLSRRRVMFASGAIAAATLAPHLANTSGIGAISCVTRTRCRETEGNRGSKTFS